MPTFCLNLNAIITIIYNESSVYIYTKSGDLLVCGCNVYGQLGLGHETSITSFELCLNAFEVKCV